MAPYQAWGPVLCTVPCLGHPATFDWPILYYSACPSIVPVQALCLSRHCSCPGIVLSRHCLSRLDLLGILLLSHDIEGLKVVQQGQLVLEAQHLEEVLHLVPAMEGLAVWP